MNQKLFFVGMLLLSLVAFSTQSSLAADVSTIERPARIDLARSADIADPEVESLPDCTSECRVGQKTFNRYTTLSFQKMWALIVKYQRARESHFSPELIAAILWEESGFRMVEHPTSRAVGFGQIMPATLRGINKRFGTTYTPEDLLKSADASVDASILALELAWEWKRDKVEALHAYAGGAKQKYIVHKWLLAETTMQRAHVPYAASFGMNAYVRHSQIRALRLCSQPGFDPQVLFD